MKKVLMSSYDVPPPPPPETSKTSNKKILVIAVVAVLVVALIIGAYVLMNQNPNTQPNNNASPTSVPTSGSPSSSPTGNSPNPTNPASEVSSFRYKMSLTSPSQPEADIFYTYSFKNIGTSNMMYRIDVTMSEGTSTTIVNGAQQKAWMIYDGEVMDLSYAFTDHWNDLLNDWGDIQNEFADWPGTQEWVYTVQGTTARIYDVEANPSLSDTLFQP